MGFHRNELFVNRYHKGFQYDYEYENKKTGDQYLSHKTIRQRIQHNAPATSKSGTDNTQRILLLLVRDLLPIDTLHFN